MFSQLPQMPHNVETRWFSAENWLGEKGQGGQSHNTRKGSPCFPLAAGEQKCLAHYDGGSGCLRRIWLTINNRTPQTLRGLRIQFYWDGADKPAVDAPLGDFFGQGLGRCFRFESAINSNPEGRSFNTCIPMPFKTGMRVELINESGIDIQMVFYDINITINDPVDDDTLYFHAYWHRQQQTTMYQDFEFLPHVNGRGSFLGVNVSVIANQELYFKGWWGEGECKCYIDGDDALPTLCGTGTEDYIGTAWGQGQYDHLYQGCPVADGEHMQYCFYRYHIPDPIYFHKDLRVCMQQIGGLSPQIMEQVHGIGGQIQKPYGEEGMLDLQHYIDEKKFSIHEREDDDWSSCAYFYLDAPSNALPELQSAEIRTAGNLIHAEVKRLDA